MSCDKCLSPSSTVQDIYNFLVTKKRVNDAKVLKQHHFDGKGLEALIYIGYEHLDPVIPSIEKQRQRLLFSILKSSFANSNKRMSLWSEEERKYFLELCNKHTSHGCINFDAVSMYMKSKKYNRTKKACKSQYKRWKQKENSLAALKSNDNGNNDNNVTTRKTIGKKKKRGRNVNKKNKITSNNVGLSSLDNLPVADGIESELPKKKRRRVMKGAKNTSANASVDDDDGNNNNRYTNNENTNGNGNENDKEKENDEKKKKNGSKKGKKRVKKQDKVKTKTNSKAKRKMEKKMNTNSLGFLAPPPPTTFEIRARPLRDKNRREKEKEKSKTNEKMVMSEENSDVEMSKKEEQEDEDTTMKKQKKKKKKTKKGKSKTQKQQPTDDKKDKKQTKQKKKPKQNSETKGTPKKNKNKKKKIKTPTTTSKKGKKTKAKTKSKSKANGQTKLNEKSTPQSTKKKKQSSKTNTKTKTNSNAKGKIKSKTKCKTKIKSKNTTGQNSVTPTKTPNKTSQKNKSTTGHCSNNDALKTPNKTSRINVRLAMFGKKKEDRKNANKSKENSKSPFKPRQRKGPRLTAGDVIFWHNVHGLNSNNLVPRSSVITKIWTEPRERNNSTSICFEFWPKYSRCKPKWSTKIRLNDAEHDGKWFQLKQCNFNAPSQCIIQIPQRFEKFNEIRLPNLNSFYRKYIKVENSSNQHALDLAMRSDQYETGIPWCPANVNIMSDFFSLTHGLQKIELVEMKREENSDGLCLWKKLEDHTTPNQIEL